jgi:hypothetical protein
VEVNFLEFLGLGIIPSYAMAVGYFGVYNVHIIKTVCAIEEVCSSYRSIIEPG